MTDKLSLRVKIDTTQSALRQLYLGVAYGCTLDEKDPRTMLLGILDTVFHNDLLNDHEIKVWPNPLEDPTQSTDDA